MAQQTAVEWLLQQIKNKNGKEFTSYYSEFIEQAKQMEKEQRIKDYNAGFDDAKCNHINDAENYTNEQEYLNN